MNKSKKQIIPSVGEDVGKRTKLLYACAECYILVNHFGKIFESLLKLNICVLHDSAIPFRLYIHQKRKVMFTKNRNKINNPKSMWKIFMARFIISKLEATQMPIDSRVNKLWYLHTMEYYIHSENDYKHMQQYRGIP